jgi:hypothetical protein
MESNKGERRDRYKKYKGSEEIIILHVIPGRLCDNSNITEENSKHHHESCRYHGNLMPIICAGLMLHINVNLFLLINFIGWRIYHTVLHNIKRGAKIQYFTR